jgi:16S rRNA (uracil1498-N3)-methyltransferase
MLVKRAEVGRIQLPPAQAHHCRDVLRMSEGDRVEVFDRAGARGRGTIASIAADGVSVQIDEMSPAIEGRFQLTIAAAVPKGTRADWMIEKLSELGVDRFIPLIARRSVVLPRGTGKSDRWARLAEESARQSERSGVMRIDPLTDISALVERAKAENMIAWHLSLAENSVPIAELIGDLPPALMVLVGPEGGWTTEESALLESAGIGAVRLTGTVLRVETAAVAAAAVIQSSMN